VTDHVTKLIDQKKWAARVAEIEGIRTQLETLAETF
jgi:hypothetical protein